MKKHPRLIKIGQHIRAIRKNAGYSQEDFAHELDMDRAFYGGIERGVRNASALILVRIAIKLNVEVGDLFPSTKILKRISQSQQ